ncbi:GNAT family N-acetyltransferase [Motilibacter deserti]|uniref:GNAT family N-acetyltransferase n=1 Tax=Motilibacter deserti TaxID=2714956 RepID=A0ABX0GRY3_9ACTN|nr:GNAT family N-acetyltransferase [Motilibacter deserti]NHC12470.1 GNAT family N-acetyltransferase [Motilibacter deserti]
MEPTTSAAPRVCSVEDAGAVAALLDAFNREYGDPTPGVGVLATRLRRLLAGDAAIAVLAGEPAVGVALLSVRLNVWYDGPVAVLDELYVVPGLRGHGIGSGLLRAAEAVVIARGGELVEINVDGDDVDARRFYERHGYSNSEPGRDEQLLYYYRELTAGPVTPA